MSKAFWIVMVIAGLCLGGMFSLMSSANRWALQTVAAAHGTPTHAADSEPQTSVACTEIGEVCRLEKVSTRTNFVPVATSLEAYNEFRKYFLASDSEGIAQMALTGKILGASGGDGFRILDQSVFNGWTEGRLTSGEYARRHVWATMQWVTK
jgi:hypothetical protein